MHSTCWEACARQCAWHLCGCSPAPAAPASLRSHRSFPTCRPVGQRRALVVPCRVDASPDLAKPASGGDVPGNSGRGRSKQRRKQAVGPAEKESLQLLEWPALCRQVASFAQTPMGAGLALAGRLPMGRSRAASETMLQETLEAAAANLDFTGAYDLSRAVDAAEVGQVLHPMVLGAVATTLAAARKLRAAAAAGGQRSATLHVLAADIGDAQPELQAAIETCIQADDGRLVDTASPQLAATRAARRANLLLLRQTSEEWARAMFAAGAAERPQVVVRRDRLCIPLRAGRQGELPRGSVALAASASGSTVYVEPAPLVPLNNAEAALGAGEREEEERVLRALSLEVGSQAGALRRVLAAVTALDVAAARARHAAWLGAMEPSFCGPDEAARAGAVRIPGALHPLLLQPSLPPAPMPPVPDAPAPAAEPGFGSLAGLSMVPELWSRMVPQPAGGGSSRAGAGADEAAPRAPQPPVPVDLQVPAGTAVVAVTGPNTGGKTASLKALGLLSLMAKAGLFIPAAASRAGSTSTASVQPRLLWFDRVLADLGDGQSLQQSLSTFSGHVRRLRGVLREATPASLVLLDEVGSGTDPGEGAALAAAVLLRLADSAALTYATTHHSELKELAASHPGFVNASVEFDVATLRPTYRLLWGRAGESNALAVAEGLGFSPAVVAEARQVAAELQAGRDGGATRSVALQQSLLEQLADAEHAAAAAAGQRAAAEAAAAAAQRALEGQRAERAALDAEVGAGKADDQESKRAVMRIVSEVRGGRMQVQQAEAELKRIERQAGAADRAALTLVGLKAGEDGEMGGGGVREGERWVPLQGESVRIRKMGGATGVVLSAGGSSSGGGKVSVRVGSMAVELRATDLEPAGSKAAAQQQEQEQERELQQQSGASKAASKVGRKLRATGVLQGGGGQTPSAGSALGVAIQTSRNTVDVRGMTPDDAVAAVEIAVSSCRCGDVVFVVHGVGTGRVRAAVLSMLKANASVAKAEEAEASNGGCTVVYVR